jgi:hypothetical protein
MLVAIYHTMAGQRNSVAWNNRPLPILNFVSANSDRLLFEDRLRFIRLTQGALRG